MKRISVALTMNAHLSCAYLFVYTLAWTATGTTGGEAQVSWQHFAGIKDARSDVNGEGWAD